MREIERHDSPHVEAGGLKLNVSFILGWQIAGEAPRLFCLCAESNFIEADAETCFLQTGKAKYGKPILDLAITPAAMLQDATESRARLARFDDAQQPVGRHVDRPALLRTRQLEGVDERHLESCDAYFEVLTNQWVSGTRKVFRELPALAW